LQNQVDFKKYLDLKSTKFVSLQLKRMLYVATGFREHYHLLVVKKFLMQE